MSDKYVILKGTMFFKDAELKTKTKRLSEAALFSKLEAEAAVEGKKGDAVTFQPLSFYKDFLIGERVLIDEKLSVLGIGS